MVEKNHPTQNANESNDGQENADFGELRWVLIIGAWAFIGLLLAAVAWPNLAERMKFFIGNLWILVTAFAVIAQVVIYRKQWAVMRLQIASAEKNSVWANRAYVVAKIRGVGNRDHALQFVLRIQNTGNTPANDVAVSYSYGLRDKPPHEEFPDHMVVFDSGYTKTERLGLVAPNGSYHVIKTPETPFQSTMQSDLFGLEQIKFYCWGRIVYEDMFNERRHTDFCFVQSWDKPNGYPCEHGNEAF